MCEKFYQNKNIIVADFDYQSALFLFKNAHPELDIKIISRNDLINKISYSFLKDPIPYLINKGIGYKKAKKYLDILLTADHTKNEELNKLFNELNEAGYLVKDEYGAYELKDSHIYLFEMEQDTAIMELLKRNNLEFQSLRLEGLELVKNNAYISPNIIYFENKFTQFFYIFSWIRDKTIDNVSQKHRIIINGDEDIFYVKIMSDIFNLPICYVEERPLLSVKSVKAKINEIYRNKSFNFNEEELVDQDIKVLKELIEYYELDKKDDFAFSYANLLEIVASKNTRIPNGNGGVVITNKFVFDPTFYTYVTNFNSDAFYKVFSDDNVLPDAILKEIGYNTSYNKTAMDRRKKKNFLRHNNVAVISRVKKHLNDKIFDSPLIDDLGWKDKIRDEEKLELPTYTSEAAYLRSSMELDRSGLKFDSNVFNAYDPSFKGINNGKDFRKKTWSVTGLETYVNCPFKYYLSNLIPLKRNDYSRRFIGTSIHKVFEKFNHVDFNVDQALKEGELAYYEQFKKADIIPTPKDKAYLEIAQYWLRKFIKAYRKNIEGISFDEPPKDDYEKDIYFSLEDDKKETYNFRGTIDKVIISEANGHKYYSIVDYKTGIEEFNPQEVFLGKSIQIPLYYYAIDTNIQPDYYTKGAEFGGFYIQHIFFTTIKSALKDANKPTISEKRLINQSRLGGISKNDVSYIASIDPSAFKKDGSLKSNGGSLLQIKHQFNEVDGKEEQIIDDSSIGLNKYNFNDLVEDAKKAAIQTINKICDGDFSIAPTSYSLNEFNIERIACNNCPYRPVCYRHISDAVDYRKLIAKRFHKGGK
ncbi:MAG: PD-(D/E)XK nuclease family protein [Bacilli bacterium]|nr:PD-(D/E)XK nuclease family protein [Bacilli bacterium]